MGGVGWRALATRPWLLAPLLLRREPAVLLAVAAAAAVLGLTGAAAPLYASSVGTAALAEQDKGLCPELVAPYLRKFMPIPAPGDVSQPPAAQPAPAGQHSFLAVDRRVTADAATLPQVTGPPSAVLLSAQLKVGATPAAAGTGTSEATLVAKDGFLSHIVVVRDAGGSGVWVPDTLATQAGLHAGGPLTVAYEDTATATRVRGVYRDLTYSGFSRKTLPRFWCEQNQLYPKLFSSTLGDAQPPPAVLLDRALFAALDRRLAPRADIITWDVPIDRRALTLAKAERLVRALGARAADRSPAGLGPGAYAGELPRIAVRSHAIRGSVAAATTPVSLAGSLVALLLVGGAGSFWFERRRSEIGLLSSRGVGPVALGVKAALEMLPAVVLGGAAGWAAALLLVRLVAPSPLVEAGVPTAAATRAGGAVAVGLVLLALVAGLQSRSTNEQAVGRRRSRWRLVPVELTLIAGAVLIARRLHDPTGAAAGAAMPTLNRGLLSAPLLLLVGTVLLTARLARLALAGLRRRRLGQRWPAVPWLATRQLLGAPSFAVALLAATALPVGVLIYATVVTGSSRATLTAKLGVFVGAATQVAGEHIPQVLPAGLPAASTLVLRASAVSVGGQQVDLLGVDPGTWAKAAAWDASYSPTALPTLLARLTHPNPLRPGEPLPVVAVAEARQLPTGAELAPTSTGAPAAEIAVVGKAQVAPGYAGNGLLIADARAVRALAPGAERQIWSTAPLELLLPALQRRGIDPTFALDANTVLDSSVFLPISWTFEYLQAVGVLAALVGIAGLVLALEARQRTRALALALASRMGLTGRRHFAALLLELAPMILAGGVAGAGLGAGAAASIYRNLDPDPSVAPHPLFRLPLAVLLLTAGALLVIVLAAAGFARVRAAGTPTAGLLRE